jgi:phage tail-like protein
MGNGRMYITLNRNSEWRRCLLANLETKDNKIVFPNMQDEKYGMLFEGILVTGSIDSTEHDFQWDSVLIEGDMPENSVIKVSYYASDDKQFLLGDKLFDLDDYIRDAKISVKERLASLSHLFSYAFTGAVDGLIKARGRYLWLKLEFLVPGNAEFSLRKIKLLLADEKIIDYLPGIYRENQESSDFFPRFMDIFDSVFFDIEDKVNRVPEKLDYTIAQGEMLRFLASWVGLNDTQNAEDEKIRQRIANLAFEYRSIGTKKGIEHFIERELGFKPNIVEYFNFKKMLVQGRDREIYKELFGTNPFKFYILLPEKAFSNRRNINSFLRKLKNSIPAHTEVEIILLKQAVILDKHTYLGVNSIIGEFNYVSVDENIAISYDTLIGGNPDEK